MNALTAEWVEKAEGDYVTAQREIRARRAPNYDAACFHTQQAAEKYLKGFLQEQNFPPPKIHNLAQLLQLCLPYDAQFQQLDQQLGALDAYAVRYRYPGDSATKADARSALQNLQQARTFVRGKLGLT